MSDDKEMASSPTDLSDGDEEGQISQDQEQIEVMGSVMFDAMNACIESTNANDFLMSSLGDLLAEGLPSGEVVSFKTLNTSYWLEAFVRSTPQICDILQMEHSINRFIKKKESILFTL
jgi:hypothetical protein